MHRWQLGVLCVALGLGGVHAAELTEEEELTMAFGDKSFVSIATGTRVPVTRAPAVATVITAEDIKAIGATDLDEVLETVPGLHVARSTQGYAPIYTIRGVRGNLSNPQVLMLVNGIPVTNVFDGGRGNAWAGLPLENVARIEVIRGPGSALYGADAFAGVINIITKTAPQIGGTQVGARVGSFDSQDAWVLHGTAWGPFEVAAYLGAGSTRGARPIIGADAQSALDAAFGAFGVPPVSHAPGPASLGHDSVDAGLDVAWGAWRWRAGLKQRENIGVGAGIAQALDPTGRSASRRFTSDLSWQAPNLPKDWELGVQASYMHYRELSDLVLFPAGSNLGLGFFEDGVIGNPYKWERHARLGASGLYTGLQRHRIRLGAGFDRQALYKIRETKNFNPDFSPIGTGSLADVIDVSDTLPFIRPTRRSVRYVYAQDEWNFSKDWTLTAGVRQDRYSDFGSTTNPRVALVWEAAYDLTTKLMYGSAFRAPAFVELYAINNPVAMGNAALQPEKMRTLEAAVSWQASERARIGLNLFRYQMTDIIRLDSAGTYQNSGKQTGSGLELEAAWDALKQLRLSANYGYQRSVDDASGQDAGLAPRHHLLLRADWRAAAGWRANTQLNLVGKRAREPGDARAPVAGYASLDLTLRSDRLGAGIEWALSARNLFDADRREPSPFGQPFVSIPDDLPLAGRSVYLEATYRF
jgi:outer membrane receptor for ferrienterochelin and colicins